MSDDTNIIVPVDDQPLDRYTDWYGFDTENDSSGLVTLAALIHESGEKWIWKGAGHLGDWCVKQKGKPVVICHNLEYDLVNEFGSHKYAELQLNYLKGRLISATLGNVKFLDSFNHFRMSLNAIGKSIGIDKLAFDIHSEEYVTTDAWICLKVMTMARDYIASLGGQIGATSGSSAVSVWKYMTESEFCTGAVDTPWLRKGYYGGRTEIFRRNTVCEPGQKLIKGYDINSMYPFCMLTDYPEYLVKDLRFEKAKGMAEVTISVPQDLYVAPLVYRDAKTRLLYPVGIFRGVWTYEEIRRAEKLGAKVIKVHDAMGCNTLVRPFDQFIHTLYNRRKVSTSESERLFLKVLMNSLYGKLATKSTITRTVSRYNLVKSKSRRMEDVKWISYHRGLLDFQTPPPDYVNVMWGAMITANSRSLLTDYLDAIPAEKLIYCDTDSVYCLDHELPISNELGGMKLEKEANTMKIVQPKAYQLDDFYKAKGVPKPRADGKDGIKIDFAKQYIEEGFTEFQAPIRFRASLGSKRGTANQWVKHSKGRKTEYGAKRLSGERYFPPVISQQMDLLKDGDDIIN